MIIICNVMLMISRNVNDMIIYANYSVDDNDMVMIIMLMI
jgi:hypothetical protein